MLISESDDGRDTARIRQNAGKVLNAVKNSGEARRTIIGGTNLPESTSCAEMTVVFSSRRLRRAGQDCARDVSGARAQSASAHPERWNVIEALALRPTLILLDEMDGSG
jgi:hypothetical protein